MLKCNKKHLRPLHLPNWALNLAHLKRMYQKLLRHLEKPLLKEKISSTKLLRVQMLTAILVSYEPLQKHFEGQEKLCVQLMSPALEYKTLNETLFLMCECRAKMTIFLNLHYSLLLMLSNVAWNVLKQSSNALVAGIVFLVRRMWKLQNIWSLCVTSNIEKQTSNKI